MNLHVSVLDWWIIGGICALTMIIGLSAAKLAGKSVADFFIGGRSMPWWLLGFSMVATTFSSDTPNLVANFVREYGVFGNWVWWAMLPSGAFTIFVFAKLWRRSEAITDIEFYELRYSGKIASFLRGFRAVYLGFFFDVLILANCTLAAIKMGATMLNLTPLQSVLTAMIITTIFSAASGLRGVLLSDFFLFVVAMVGAISAAYFTLQLPEVGGLSGMVEKMSASEELSCKMRVMGYASTSDLISLFIIPFTVIWWSVFYPGAEPGGGGFLVQRMLAAKNENHAVGATLFFNVAHYALRPWPWILVALCSLIVYPDRASLIKAVGDILPEHQIQSDIAYSLMLTKMPSGWLGVVMASLIAAYVSTISTLLNWGSSCLVNDFYTRFLHPDATQKDQVRMARLSTVILMIAGGVVALYMDSALSIFNIILSIGAGTGLIFMVRWFWWRINAAAELTAMISSFILAIYFNAVHGKLFPKFPLSESESMIFSVVGTTICWIIAAYFGGKTDKEVLFAFCRKINPSGPGWNKIRVLAEKEGISLESKVSQTPLVPAIVASIFSCVAIYATLFAIGDLIYFRYTRGSLLLIVAFVFGIFIKKLWKKIR